MVKFCLKNTKKCQDLTLFKNVDISAEAVSAIRPDKE